MLVRLNIILASVLALGVSAAVPPSAPPVHIEMRNVHLHAAQGVVLEVSRLQGDLVSTRRGVPVFDDPQSFAIEIASARIAIDMTSLTTLVNEYVFGYPGSPLENLRVAVDGDRLAQSGTLHKGLSVPFKIQSRIATSEDGRLLLHAEAVKAAGVPAGRLMKIFGLELDELLKVRPDRGIEVHDNDLLLSPARILPPPRIRGRVLRAWIEDGRLVQEIGGAAAPAELRPPAPGARNYVYFGKGTIRFGKLTMSDADLQLIDADPRDPFDFYPARYNAQLVAGFSKNTPAHGLKVYMPDFGQVQR